MNLWSKRFVKLATVSTWRTTNCWKKGSLSSLKSSQSLLRLKSTRTKTKRSKVPLKQKTILQRWSTGSHITIKNLSTPIVLFMSFKQQTSSLTTGKSMTEFPIQTKCSGLSLFVSMRGRSNQTPRKIPLKPKKPKRLVASQVLRPANAKRTLSPIKTMKTKTMSWNSMKPVAYWDEVSFSSLLTCLTP